MTTPTTNDRAKPLFKQNHRSYKTLDSWKNALAFHYLSKNLDFVEDGPLVVCFLTELDPNDEVDQLRQQLQDHFGNSTLGVFNTGTSRGRIARLPNKDES